MNQNTHIDEALLLRYLEGEVTLTERQEVEVWLASSEENRKLAKQVYYLSFATKTVDTLKRTDAQAALKKVRGRMKEKQQRQWWQWTQWAAAFLAIPLLLSTLYLWFNASGQDKVNLIEVRTNPGMIASTILPDGTYVALNSNSTLIYPSRFDEDSRNVQLDGEAYFKVTKNGHHPFKVKTPQKAVIKVYGTQFNVEAYAADEIITATLVEGSIAMAYENKKSDWAEKKILPGQEIVYTATQQNIKVDQADVEVAIAWKDGKLIFRDTPFREVLKTLSKRFNVDFVVKDPKCFEASFTGVLQKQRLERILEYISVSSGIKFKYEESKDIHQEKQKIEVY